MDIQKISYTGLQIGLGIAFVPVTVTSLIACSRIIFINIITDTIMRILTANTYTATVHRVSFVAVPVLWKASLYAAITGGAIAALSLITAFVNSLYEQHMAAH